MSNGARRSLRSYLGTDETKTIIEALKPYPLLTQLLDRDPYELSVEDLNAIRSALGEALTARGFKNADHVNAFGEMAEALIDKLSPWHWKLDSE